jgi:Ca2+-binding EF-hand superfamily protein
MSSFVKEGNTKLEEIFQHTIDEVDTDHDGHINFEEFKELMLDVS